ncbi:hypothetical protein [Mesorhizobium sp. M0767]|uniref:hypothetical protein n=1 Tax=Mesorhizobium sp. M0767 TaxID=2956995 RepID=UPI00333DD4CD
MASTSSPARITELDAVNIMLANIGEAPVNSLGPTSKPTAQRAVQRLAEESIQLQSKAYNFSAERKLTLEPDAVTGRIALPSTILSWSATYTSVSLNLTEDNGELYNTGDSTFIFTAPVYVEAVLARPFTSLAQPVRWYITCSAAIAFANTEQPGGAYLRVTSEIMNEAKRAFETYDRRLLKGGLRVHNPHFRRLRGNR